MTSSRPPRQPAVRSERYHRTVPLWALAAGGFGIGLTEFAVVGVLPEVGHDLGVAPTTASLLVSVYAVSVAVGAVVLTAATLRLGPKPVLVTLMCLFIVGNTLSGVAPTFGLILVGRVIAALCHGTFFGVGAVLATSLVAPQRKASAISVMFGGLTLANVLGVPLGTFIAQLIGWRWTFGIISLVGAVALVGLIALVPNDAGRTEAPARLRNQLAAFRVPQVWLSLAVTAFGFGGIFGSFTYVTFTLNSVSGFVESVIPILLMVFGAALFAGNWVGGRLADSRPFATVLGFLVVLAADLVAFGLLAALPAAAVVCLALMGFFGFGTVPGMQLRTLRYAGEGERLSSAANIAAFNIGNAVGAWACGLGISAGGGFTSSLFLGAGLTAVAVIVLLIATVTPRGGASAAPPRPETAGSLTADRRQAS